jgi:hypothetical protein
MPGNEKPGNAWRRLETGLETAAMDEKKPARLAGLIHIRGDMEETGTTIANRLMQRNIRL